MFRESASGVRLIGRALRRHRRRLWIGYPLIVLWQLSETLVPVVIGLVIDRGVVRGQTWAFVSSLLLLIGLFAILSYSYRFGSRFIVRSIESEAHQLRTEIAGHVLRPRGARTDLLPGQTLSLATSDAELTAVVLRQLAFVQASLISVTVVAIYVLGVDLVLGLIILLGVPLVLLLIQLATPLVARRTDQQQASAAETTGLAADLVHGLRPLKGIGGEDVAQRRYRHVSLRAQNDTIAVARSWGWMAAITTGLSGVLLALVAAIAGVRALNGDITLGELVALVGLTQFLAEPLAALGGFSAQFAASRASATRIAGFLASPPLMVAGTEAPLNEAPQICLLGISAEPIVDLSLTTAAGELLALAVDDPATASALVSVLNGERAIDDGSAWLGETRLADLSTQARHASLVVSPHDAQIFDGTLHDIVDPDRHLTCDQLDEVLAASAADEVVSLHPDGLDRVVRSSILSGGQRQRLALARALASAAPLLVLQDPTSAVDTVTEQAIAERLRSLRAAAGKTTVIVTSSPAFLNQADRVLFVTEGRVAARGTHHELLTDPLYREAVLR